MRRMLLSLTPLALLSLAACGEGGALDNSLKGGVRQQLVATCTATASAQVPEGVSVDLDRLCDCAADKIMANKSLKELAASPPTPSEALASVSNCVSEMGGVKLDPAGAAAAQ